MKTINSITKILLLTLLLLLTVKSFAQIRLVEIDPATESVKIHNYGSSTIDISNYKLCVFPSYPSLNSLNISNGSLNLAAGADVTMISTANLNEAGGELGLYINTNSFGDPNNIVDYVQWISSGNTREPVAVSAGIWSMATAISNSISPPYQYNGNGVENGSSNWGSTLSIEDFILNDFLVYPNPSKDYINVLLPKSSANASVAIYDLFGKQVYRLNAFNNQKLNVTNLNNGIYLLKVLSLGKTKTKLFVKQ